MGIHAGCQDANNMTVAQYSVNTAKSVRHEMDHCNGVYKVVISRKRHSRRLDYDRMKRFMQQQAQF